MKHFIILLACVLCAAVVYGFWLYSESLQLERQGRGVPYLELLKRDWHDKQEALSGWSGR